MEQKLSIVVPAYNEREVLREFHRRLAAVLAGLDLPCEVLYVNDGSTDDTLAVLYELSFGDSRIGVLNLSRNFGKEIAMTAGLDYAGGDAVIVIDADLQDPPELIPKLLAEWRGGCDVVYAKRIARDGESVLKRATAHAFYRLMQRVGKVRLPEDTGDFRLLSRRAVDALKALRERHRFMKGLFTWIGYPQKAVLYRRDQRFAGNTKWNYWRLWNFALEGITSFTTAPLKMATYAGLITAMGALSYGAFMFVRTMLYGNPVPGYPSLMVVILFLGGIQLITLGIVGEYLARLFDEAKQRPLYLIDDYRAPSVLKDSVAATTMTRTHVRISADTEAQ
jgi:glycosyltransferase involved in cell wall biosynthesis